MATRPRKGVLLHAPARHEEDARPQGLTCSQGREDREGRGRGKRKKEGSAHARPEPQSCSPADRVNTSKKFGPGATAPPVTLVVPSSQALHLAFNRSNYKKSLSCTEERPTQPEKPIRNVANRDDCTAFRIRDANPLSEHAQSHGGVGTRYSEIACSKQ